MNRGVFAKRWMCLSLLILAFIMLGGIQCRAQQSSADVMKGTGLKDPDQRPSVTLDELIQAAVAGNPSIQAAEHSVNAKKAMILPARTLPDPNITFQHMGDLVPLRLQAGDPSSARTIGIEQEIPFPGKLGLKGKIASAEADVEEWNHVLTHRQVVSELKQAFYDLFMIHRSMEIVRKNKDLLQSFEQIAETKYQVGQGVQQDALKAQVEISKLIDRLAVLDQRRSIAEAQINNLLFRSPETPIGKPAEFQKAELKYTIEQLNQFAQAGAPALKAQEGEVSRRQYSVDLAGKEYYPDFALGFTYFDRQAVPEMYGVMVKAKVPLYFWRKQRPELDSARSSLVSAQRMRESTSSTIGFQIKQGYTMATTSERLVKLYSGAVVPQARLSLESAIANYQVGKADFLTLIDSLTALLEYELKYYESLSEFQKALAQIEPIVGVELTR